MTMTACSRPGYLVETLDSLAANQNLDQFTLHFGVEPVSQEVLDICRAVDFMDTHIHVNSERLGVRENPYQLLKRTFAAGYEGVLYLEDDVVLSPDAVDLVLHYANSPEAERHRCLCLYNMKSLRGADPTTIEVNRAASNFAPLGFFASASAWYDFFDPMWHASSKGWDYSITGSDPKNLIALPSLSRSHHIGRFGGTYYAPAQHDPVYENNAHHQDEKPSEYRFTSEEPKPSCDQVTSMVFPKIIHQIWIGPNKRPDVWMDSVRQFCADYGYEYRLWSEPEIDALGLVNKAQYDAMHALSGKANIARYEILFRFGGTYIDADSVVINPSGLDALISDFDADLGCGREPNPELLANGVLLAQINSRFLAECIDVLPTRNMAGPSWKTCGPQLITDIYAAKNQEFNVRVYPSECFYPIRWHGLKSINLHESMVFLPQSVLFQYGYSTNNLASKV